MGKETESNLAEWEASRDLEAELRQTLEDMKAGRRGNVTQISQQMDGTMRRVVTSSDGTVIRDHIVPTVVPVASVRTAAGLSQAQFAQLMGVSKRTLQDWEQGRRTPSGAARTLLLVASKHPEVLQEVLVR